MNNKPAPPPDLDALRQAMMQALQKDREQRLRWGEQGPVLQLNPKKWGKRLVAVRNRIFTFPPDATFHDFLGAYIKHILGEDWWIAEAAKPDGEAHQLALWQQKVFQFQIRHLRGQGLQAAPSKGVVGHYYRLAFDLLAIEHQGLLQASLVKRLKIPEQFQGARYEVIVSAAFVRGGFKVELEPEGKGPDRLCEFVATHQASGAAYAVEAKSRHIPGVLGRRDDTKGKGVEEPNVTGLIRKALKKRAEHTRVVCVDVNVPQLEGTSPPLTWGRTVRKQVNQLEAAGSGPAILFFTNSPLHYLGDDDLSRGDAAMIMGLSEPRFQPQDSKAVEREFPGLMRVATAFSAPVPEDWE